MIYSFNEARAAERRTTQYFEMFGNRAIYNDGWVAAARHSIPWLLTQNPPLEQDKWELYNVAEDFSQANDLAAQNPAKLKELQDLFTKEAVKKHVLPIDDRRSERFDAAIAGRPDLLGPRTSLDLYEGMKGIAENAFINLKGRSYKITSDIEVPQSGAEGVVIAQAGRFGGWSIYMKAGRIHHVYNFGGMQWTTVSSAAALARGRHTVTYEFVYDGGQPGSGGISKLSVDGGPSVEARVPKTIPFIFSADEGVDVGLDAETPVTDAYAEGRNGFTGRIHKVTVQSTPPAQSK